jgi:hypothetical protein
MIFQDGYEVFVEHHASSHFLHFLHHYFFIIGYLLAFHQRFSLRLPGQQ